MGRFAIGDEIQRLDPERDHQRVVHRIYGWGFCWETVCAFDVGG